MSIFQKNKGNNLEIRLDSFSAARPINHKNPPNMKRLDNSYLRGTSALPQKNDRGKNQPQLSEPEFTEFAELAE